MKTGEIEIPAVDHIERPWFYRDLIEDVHIVYLSMGDHHHYRNTAPEVQKGVEFDSPFVFSEYCPREERQTEIDGGGVQSIHRLLELQAERIVDIQLPGSSNKDLGKVGIDTPIPHLVGTGQGVSGDLAAYPQMVEFGLGCPKTGFDIYNSKLWCCHKKGSSARAD